MIYTRDVQLYELDQMGIVHHSNYIRYLEEARLYAMKAQGYGYEKIISMGLASPVMSLSATYLKSATYPDQLNITIRLLAYDGVRFRFAYDIHNQKGDKCFAGETSHCLIGKSGLPVRIPRQYPEVDQLMRTWLEKDLAETGNS